MTPEQYFLQLRLIIVTLDIVQEFEVRDEFISEDVGYMRLRLNLVNGDIAEMFEYVVRENGRLKTINYSFHLQNAKGALLKRWDNAPHHRSVSNFPHHCHDGSSGRIISSRAMTGRAFLKELKKLYPMER
ncbi:MAG: toxin-antitoxin system TumE family protein [Bacillota bacterium]